MLETIHIALVTNENYAQHAGVMITSLLHNKQSANPIVIHILGDKLSKTSLDRLEEIAKNYNMSINFYVVDEEMFKELPPYPPMSNSYSAYFKIVLPYVLSNKINKVLYVDVDMIVRKDITELWNTNIDNYYLAAVEDYPQELGWGDFSEIKSKLRIPENEPYFNSGLMLINLKKWRENDILHKVITFTKNNSNKLAFADQDAFNAILFGKWLHISPKWNMMGIALQIYHGAGRNDLDLEIIESAKDPNIVHFAGEKKRPWHYVCINPYAKEYWKYLKMTSWKDYSKPLPSNLKDLLGITWEYFKFLIVKVGQYHNYVKLRRYLKKV